MGETNNVERIAFFVCCLLLSACGSEQGGRPPGAAVPVVVAEAKVAGSRAQTLASELRVNIGEIVVGTDIAISVNKIEELSGEAKSPPSTLLELEWEAAKMPRLFPFMRAELRIYLLSETETQLDFSGSYEPPLGALGDAMDAVVGHRVAEASVHRFLSDVAAHLRNILSGT